MKNNTLAFRTSPYYNFKDVALKGKLYSICFDSKIIAIRGADSQVSIPVDGKLYIGFTPEEIGEEIGEEIASEMPDF